MWNYLKGLLHNPLFKRLSAVFILVSSVMGLVYLDGGTSAGEIFLVWLIAFGTLAAHLILEYNDARRPVFPYWGEKFGVDECIVLLSNETFKLYNPPDGRPVENFEISDSGRWFCIKGQYFPAYLVYDFDPSTAELTMIDGAKINIKEWAKNQEIQKALEDYLKGDRTFRIDDNYHIDISPEDCALAFKKCFGGNYKELVTADWDQVRYRWEWILSKLEVDDLDTRDYHQHNRALGSTDFAGDAILNRVLLDDEIRVIAASVRSGKISGIKNWFELSAYKDDMCVCNGVKLLRSLGYPKNEAGTSFLFECLRDIQKPYFEDAVSTLEQYPYEELTAIIEHYVEKAHASGDVLWGAGLIYLSRKIGYKISLEELRDERDEANTLSDELEQEQIPRSQTMTWL